MWSDGEQEESGGGGGWSRIAFGGGGTEQQQQQQQQQPRKVCGLAEIAQLGSQSGSEDRRKHTLHTHTHTHTCSTHSRTCKKAEQPTVQHSELLSSNLAKKVTLWRAVSQCVAVTECWPVCWLPSFHSLTLSLIRLAQSLAHSCWKRRARLRVTGSSALGAIAIAGILPLTCSHVAF